MTLVSIKPWLNDIMPEEGVNELLDAFFTSGNNNSAFPNVDVYEDENNFYMIAELPGLSKEDVKLVLKDGILTLNGKIKDEFRDNEKVIARSSERFFGEFERKFELPEDINPEKIDANFENGLLKIKFEKIKPEEPKEKVIKVK